MSRLNELLKVVEQANPQLAADLQKEFAALSKRRSFGLNFERHAPETMELPGRPPRLRDKVRVLPARGAASSGRDTRTWTVLKLSTPGKDRTATIAENVQPGVDAKPEVLELPLTELVVIAESTDTIYPGLVSTGTVTRGEENRPFHAVINAENLDALRTLMFTHMGKVDAIYIDPPYNTGARDWKYNNDYVDGEDGYRHSKWLAFMERRLKLAKQLLKPESSVLIVTIDEKEYLRLGLLLEQTFGDARVTMVTSSINGAGSTRTGTFNRSAEYLYFVQIGDSSPSSLVLSDEWNPVATKNKGDIRWNLLMRSGTQPFRTTHPNLFYPVYVGNTPEGPIFHSVGEPYYGDGWQDVQPPDGTFAVWPIRRGGQEGRWQISPSALRLLIAAGFARLGKWKEAATTVYYLKAGEKKKVVDGIFEVTGHRSDGSVVTDGSDYEPRFVPTDIWRITSHDAGNSGSRLLETLLPGRTFPFPKSLYAVEDALRFFVADKPNAVVLDFFAGSGTTAHAVMRLNRQDDGHRRSITITNNEVSADEQSALRKKGLRPGDPEWEALGICDYITKPRIYAAVTGETSNGDPVPGTYKFADEFPMADGFDENVEFFTLTYEAPRSVAQNKSFAAIAPLLWLRAGAEGRRIDTVSGPYDVADTYGILFDLDHSRQFLETVSSNGRVKIAYIVTDDEPAFQTVAEGLADNVEAVRLYEAYLTNFRYNAGVES